MDLLTCPVASQGLHIMWRWNFQKKLADPFPDPHTQYARWLTTPLHPQTYQTLYKELEATFSACGINIQKVCHAPRQAGAQQADMHG